MSVTVLGKEEGYGEEDYMIDWAHSDDFQHNLKESELRFVGEPIPARILLFLLIKTTNIFRL